MKFNTIIAGLVLSKFCDEITLLYVMLRSSEASRALCHAESLC